MLSTLILLILLLFDLILIVLILKNMVSANVKSGDKCKGVVLFINYMENYLEISLKTDVYSCINENQGKLVAVAFQYLIIYDFNRMVFVFILSFYFILLIA